MLLSFCRRNVSSNILRAERVCFNVSRKQSTLLSEIPSEERQTIITDDDKGVRRIIFNNVKKRNALSYAMLSELKSALQDSADNKKVQVVILGHNGHVFSTGHNLKELQSSTGKEYHEKIFTLCREVMNLVQDIPVPVIAEVKGIATAAGCQLVATCDLAVASDKSSFAVPGVSIGLFCSTPAVALSRAINRKRALQMLYTGDPINAQEALSYGLLNEVVPEGDVEITTQRLAERITRHSRMVIGLGKRGFYGQILQGRDCAYDIAESCMIDNLQYEDAQEGINAFFEKRKPQWKNEFE